MLDRILESTTSRINYNNNKASVKQTTAVGPSVCLCHEAGATRIMHALEKLELSLELDTLSADPNTYIFPFQTFCLGNRVCSISYTFGKYFSPVMTELIG